MAGLVCNVLCLSLAAQIFSTADCAICGHYIYLFETIIHWIFCAS